MHRWLLKRRWTILGYLALFAFVYMGIGHSRVPKPETVARVRKFGRKQLQVMQYDQATQFIYQSSNETSKLLNPAHDVILQKPARDVKLKKTASNFSLHKSSIEVKGHDPPPNFVQTKLPKENPRPPILVYVYDLPEKFTSALIPCSRNASVSIATNRSSEDGSKFPDEKTIRSNLEIMLHWKFFNSRFITVNPSEADVFFIPFYPSLACTCHKTTGLNVSDVHSSLWRHLTNVLPFYQDGIPTRPHFMALGTTERHHWTKNCPLLRDHRHTRGVTIIGVEKENNVNIRNYSGREYSPLIVAPYPSIQKTEFSSETTLEDFINPTKRNNLVFFADNLANAHQVRSILKKEMRSTSLSYEEQSKNGEILEKSSFRLSEPVFDENKTIEWMRHSVFCLVPPSNTQIQKYFYDAILAGCIPVTFYPRKRNSNRVEYPFERTIDYRKMTLNIPVEEVLSGDKNTTWFLGTIPKLKIKIFQKRLFEVAPKLRYSSTIGSLDDAFSMLIKELIRYA